MLIAILIFLIIQTIISGFGLYLYWKDMPAEERKEILRKIEPTKTEIVDWQPPEDETELAEKQVEEKLK